MGTVKMQCVAGNGQIQNRFFIKFYKIAHCLILNIIIKYYVTGRDSSVAQLI